MVLVSQRPFKNTSRESVQQQGNAFANSFNDPRNIGNYESGEIAPSGRYATRYPTNIASNTAGFNIPEMADNPKNLFYGSGNGTFPSSGSASDYLVYNKFFADLLFPHSRADVREELEPLYNNSGKVYTGRGMHGGAASNAPSSGSSIDYKLNNPYKDFKDTFNGGAVDNSPASGSAIDYKINNPYCDLPDTFAGKGIQENELKVLSGGKIDLADFIRKVSQGVQKIPDLLEHAPNVINKTNNILQTINELRNIMKSKPSKKKKKKVLEDIEEITEEEMEEEEEKPKRRKKKGKKSKKNKGFGYMTNEA
jgi:hypothetical protein